MSKDERLYVFCYDISRASARRRVAECLERHATRVQRSVFEALMTRAVAEALTRRLALELFPGDSLRVYALGRDDLQNIAVFGGGRPPEAHEFYLY